MPLPKLRALATAIGHHLGLGRLPTEAQPSRPARPRTVEFDAPSFRPAAPARKTRASAEARTLAASRRRARYDMDPGSASTLKKAMRLRRIETGTEGAHDPRHLAG